LRLIRRKNGMKFFTSPIMLPVLLFLAAAVFIFLRQVS
jgi:hypothetical protein